MGHLLVSPLRSVSSLTEARDIVAGLVETGAMVPFAPKFFDLLGQATIAVFADGTVREAEIIADRSGLGRVVVA